MHGRGLAISMSLGLLSAALSGGPITASTTTATSTGATPTTPGAPTTSATFASAASPVITVNHAQANPLAANTHGMNMTAMDGASGALKPPSDTVNVAHLDPALIQRVKNAGISTLRFPAGTGGHRYQWKQGRWALNERPCWGPFPGDASYGSGMEYGIREHMAAVEAIGAETTITLNFTDGTVNEAQDLVEYLNAPVGANPNGGTDWAAIRAEDGHPQPYGVKNFAVGNEMNFPTQAYWLGESNSATKRAQLYAFGLNSSDPADRPFYSDTASNPNPVHACQPTRVDGKGTATKNDDQFVARDKTHTKYFTRHAPITVGSETVKVNGQVWTRVDSLAGHGPNDQVYTIDRRGEITFVDGVAGETATAALDVTASYRMAQHQGFVTWADALKQIDPSIRVCSSFAGQEFLDAMGSQYPFDCLAAHAYYQVQDDAPRPIGLHDKTMVMSTTKANQLANWRDKMSAAGNHRTGSTNTPHTVVTEFGTTWNSADPVPNYQSSMDATVYNAYIALRLVDRGISVAMKHALLPGGRCRTDPTFQGAGGGSAFLCGQSTGYLPSGIGRLYQLLDEGLASTRLGSGIANNPTRSYGTNTYTTLYSTATKQPDGTVLLLVVNRGIDSYFGVEVRPGMTHAPDIEAATLRGPSVDAPDYTAYNTNQNPNAIAIERWTKSNTGSGAFTMTFRPNSVTLLKIRQSPIKP